MLDVEFIEQSSFISAGVQRAQSFVRGMQRGAERPVDVRLAPTGAERRPAAPCWG